MKVHILLDRSDRGSQRLLHDIRTFFFIHAREGWRTWHEQPAPDDEDDDLVRLTIEFVNPFDAADFSRRPEIARWVVRR